MRDQVDMQELNDVMFGPDAFVGNPDAIHKYTREGMPRYRNTFEMQSRAEVKLRLQIYQCYKVSYITGVIRTAWNTME